MGTGNLGFPGLNRCGAEEARGAHNPEVIGSNPIAGISHSQFTRTCRGHSPLKPPPRKGGVRGTLGSLLTSRRSSAEERLNPDPVPLDQRKQGLIGVGYPLITGRTLDRNQPPASYVFFFIFYRSLSKYFYNSFHGILLISRFAEGADTRFIFFYMH